MVRSAGLSICWHENGQKESESHYRDGQKCGLSIFWYENGLKEQEINHDYGNKGECLVTFFAEDGSKFQEGCMKEGEKFGIWITFGKDGEPDGELHYINGDSHYIFIKRHENGKQKTTIDCKEGEDPFKTQYYDNGQKQCAGFLNQDRDQEGLWTWWYKNGQKKREEEWLRGEGRIIKEWDEKGRVVSQNNQSGNWMQKAAWLQRQQQINQMDDFFGG